VNFDFDPVTSDWPMPDALPMYESESANECAKPSLWQRIALAFSRFFEGLR
jgi:hypothetical protein